MGLPNFIDRAATAASQVLSGFQESAFKEKLAAQAVGLAFDSDAATFEGGASLDLLIRLLARLYPKIAIVALDPQIDAVTKNLQKLAKAINPDVSLSKSLRGMNVCVVIGKTCPPEHLKRPTFFIGSDDWQAKLSNARPIGSGRSSNPFGAGASACFAAANVFRAIFCDQIASGDPDTEIDLNLLTYRQKDASALDLTTIDIGDAYLVGVGAIGNGALWALARAGGVRGNLCLIDHDKVDLSNLQRYILTVQADIGKPKVDLGQNAIAHTSLTAMPIAKNWQDFVSSRADYRFERVAVALDTADDRIVVQGSLPKWITNAWTQTDDLGVSRHAFSDGKACLACLYIPSGKTKDQDVLIAEELRMPEAAMEIRRLLQTNAPVGADFVARVATAFNVQFDDLAMFIGSPVKSFHQQAVCGGLLLKLTDGQQGGSAATVPMAFQSALAGIMLVAEVLKHSAGKYPSDTTMTRMDLLRPLASHLGDPRAQDATGHCICCDRDFQEAYQKKYAV
jgi:hypothetical protein